VIQTFINRAIADRTSALDLPEREFFYEHGIEALDRFEERNLNGRDESKEQRAPAAARRAEDDQAAHSELSVIEAGALAESTPAWRAFKVALLILCINIAAAALLTIVVFDPSLALLGFFVALSMACFVGLPLLLATVSETLENDQA
jgi:hypothetical protein